MASKPNSNNQPIQGVTPPYVPENGTKTPEYGARTPEYGSTTPKYGAKTPEYGARTPVYGSTTPKYGAKTPEYGARTPEYKATPPFVLNAAPEKPETPRPTRTEPYPNNIPPFYNEVTPIFEDYITDQGKKNSLQLPLVTLPVGTILFRGVTLPNTEGQEDVRYFYRDYIGDPYEKEQVCLSPTHNVFFYPFPYVSFGAHDIGVKFKCIQVVVLVKPMNIVSAIGPYRFVRAQTWIYTGTAPFKRCSYYTLHCKDKLPEADLAREKDIASFDNCLSPEYQERTGTRGWMALAQLDTLKPTEDGSLGPMGKYLMGLSKRIPAAASELIAYMYKDFYTPMKYKMKDKKGGEKEVNIESAGFPEIALYPYSKHPGDKPIHQYAKDAKTAEELIVQHAKRDDLNYLPIAMITRKGIVNILGGEADFFSYDRLKVSSNMFTEPTETQQHAIEKHLQRYMSSLKKDGLTLPYYGNGTMHYDTRTGFFVLPQLVLDRVYKSYLIPLRTNKEEHMALAYSIIVRNYSKERMEYPIKINNEIIPRNFIFSRPASMMNIVKLLKISLPGVFLEYLAKGSELFKEEGSSNRALELFLPKEIQKVVPPAAAAPVAPSNYGYGMGGPGLVAPSGVFSPPSPTSGQSTPYMPRSPVSPRSPQDVAMFPGYTPKSGQSTPYMPRSPVSPRTPEELPMFPGYTPPESPKTPKGGSKTKRGKKKERATRRKRNTTRKGAKDRVLREYKQVFINMWKVHANRKYKGY